MRRFVLPDYRRTAPRLLFASEQTRKVQPAADGRRRILPAAAVNATEYSLGELAGRLSARLVGDPSIRIFGIASLGSAEAGQLSHLSSPAYRSQLAISRASAVILAEADLPLWSGAALVVGSPYLTFARATQSAGSERSV